MAADATSHHKAIEPGESRGLAFSSNRPMKQPCSPGYEERKVRVTMVKKIRLLGMIVLILIPGCFFNRPLTIDPGEYNLSTSSAGDEGFNGPAIKMLQVNRVRGELTVFFRNEDSLIIPYSIRPLTDWPTGCPGNLYSQKMEVFDLILDESAAAVLGIETPILVRNCPADPYVLVLREDGEIGGPSTACPYPASCLFFKPDIR